MAEILSGIVVTGASGFILLRPNTLQLAAGIKGKVNRTEARNRAGWYGNGKIPISTNSIDSKQEKIILSDRESATGLVIAVAPKNTWQAPGMTGVFILLLTVHATMCHNCR